MTDRCPTCGSSVTIRTSGEGTSHYEPGRLAEIRERVEAATPGPWVEGGTLLGPSGVETDAWAETSDSWVTFKTANAEADREFWNHARADVPFLLAQLEQAEQALAEMNDDAHGFAREAATLRVKLEQAERERERLRGVVDDARRSIHYGRIEEAHEYLRAALTAAAEEGK